MLLGRSEELKKLNNAYQSVNFECVVLYGRRHIGKTYLVSEFIKDKPAIYFSAKEINDKCNIRSFAGEISKHFHIPEIQFENWQSIFSYIGEHIGEERLILVLDNYTDACITDREFGLEVKRCIDTYLQNSKCFLIICGNHMATLDREIFTIKSPLYKYVTLKLHLRCLTFNEACEFMEGFSDEDKVRLYSCVGGTPLYLTQLDSQESFEDNIIRLFFRSSGYIYNDIFMILRKELICPVVYNSILRSVAYGKTRLREIVDEIGEDNAKISKYCKVLVDMDILDRAVPYGSDIFTSRKNSYYFTDNAHLFWYRFIFDNQYMIDKDCGEEFARNFVFGTAFDEFIVSHTFDIICMQYYEYLSNQGLLDFTPDFIGHLSDNSITVLIVSNDKAGKVIIAECRWGGTTVGASDVNDFISEHCEIAEKSTIRYEFISASGFKTDAIILSSEREDIRLLGLNDL